MQLLINNFGKFRGTFDFDFNSLSLPNESGKTTILNAYYFLLTGKTLGGFIPRNAETLDNERTEICLYGFDTIDVIKRRLDATGKQMIIVDDAVLTQSDFEEFISQHLGGVPFYLVKACAEPNLLTYEGLQPSDLKDFLTSIDILQRGDLKGLQRKKKAILSDIREAEKYALTNVSIPVQTCEPLSLSESAFLETFKHAERNANVEIKAVCECCGQPLPQEKIDVMSDKKREGITFINNKVNQSERKRIEEKKQRFESEWRDIADCQRLVDASVRARERVNSLKDELTSVEDEIKYLIEDSVTASLPIGVKIVTSVTQKNGKEKDTCELYYGSLPLKTVNTARRVEICVEMLDEARKRYLVRNRVPIIIDNAERVQNTFDDIPFVVRLSVER